MHKSHLSKEPSGNTVALRFHGGWLGALFSTFVFIIGVMVIALSGAPDEKGFWPVLLLALAVGLLLSRDKKSYSETVIDGMSQRIVMIMITAWILASSIGILISRTGLIESLSWLVSIVDLGPAGFTAATFTICCIMSLSTGSSFATILICGPILYPAGGVVGSHLPLLAGAIIAGATFGDFTAPISDTTIASALSQKVKIGPTVRSRLKYVLPVAGVCVLAYFFNDVLMPDGKVTSSENVISGNPRGLWMLLVPGLIIYLFIRGHHLLHGLMFGLLFGTALGLMLGLLSWQELLFLDLENFTARSFVIDGINRAVGISFFTILLLGLVETLKTSGLVERLVHIASDRIRSRRSGETWIAGVTTVAVLLTTHSIVAILMTAEFANRSGKRAGISGIRRSNLLSMVVCILPFVLPYSIPVILMSNMTLSGQAFGIRAVSPLEAGLYNFMAWGLTVVVVLILLTGWGFQDDQRLTLENQEGNGKKES